MTIDLASLQPLFAPRSVAVIGASSDPLKIGGRPVSFLKDWKFAGRILPVNPRSKEIQSLPAFASVGEVDGPVDLAICAVPGEHAMQALQDCAKKGVKAVIMFSAGFAEVNEEGARQQARMGDFVREAKMRLMGPNCMGSANLASGMIASFHPTFALPLPRNGRIGLVSQSGAFGGISIQMARERGIGFSHMITTGNEADVQAADALAWLAGDPHTRVIMLYLEGVRDGERMLDALELARRAKKPVVAIKLGRTDVGAKAAQSHTAALAGSDAVFDALFRQVGAYRAANIEEFFDIGCACAVGTYPPNNKVGIVTVSGGVGVLMADDAAMRGLNVEELPIATQKKFLELVPFAGVRNPLDVTGQILNDRSLLEKAITLVLSEANYGSLAVFQGASAADPTIAENQMAALKRVRAAFPDRLILVSGLLAPEFAKQLEAQGMPTAREPTHNLRAIAALHRFARTFEKPYDPPKVAKAKTKLPAGSLNEIDAMAALAKVGVPVNASKLAKTADEAAKAAESVGYPVALKVVSGDILHKTDVGGVKLRLADAAAVKEAFGEIMAQVPRHMPTAKIDGCLVAPMVGGGGVETILGVTNDPVFGPVVMFGLGGVLVEALGDVSFRVAPFDEAEAHVMIREIRTFKVLEGIRGAPPSDIDAIAKALSALSKFAAAHRDQIVSIEANPFLVRAKGKGAVALDAVVVTASARD